MYKANASLSPGVRSLSAPLAKILFLLFNSGGFEVLVLL